MGHRLNEAEFPDVPVDRFERKSPEPAGLFNFQVKTPDWSICGKRRLIIGRLLEASHLRLRQGAAHSER